MTKKRTIASVLVAGCVVAWSAAGEENAIQRRDVRSRSLTVVTNRIVINDGTKHTYKNVLFKNCKGERGGAIFLISGSLVLENCTFQNNQATGINAMGGGAVFVNAGCTATMTNCTFTGNKALNGHGGALSIYGDNVKIANCQFTKNHENTASGDGHGGAILWVGKNGRITGSTFTSNSTKTHGGAIQVRPQATGLKIDNCVFSNNTARNNDGGALSWAGSGGVIANSTFASNCAQEEGGAMEAYGGEATTITVKGCTFVSNRCVKAGGAIFSGMTAFTIQNCTFRKNVAGSSGGAFYNQYKATVKGNIFEGNVGKWGGAIYNYGESAALSNNQMIGNRDETYGGALYIYQGVVKSTGDVYFENQAPIAGGAVLVGAGATFTSTGCAFLSNKATDYPVYNDIFAGGSGKASVAKKWGGDYRIAFHANGGTGTTAVQGMNYGNTAKLRANAFKRRGYTFLGWSTAKTGKVVYKDAATVKNLRTSAGTTTLYAVWAKNTYKIFFKANGGRGTMGAQTMTYGKSAKLRANAYKRTGYSFAGWAKSAGGKVVYKNTASVKNLRKDGGTTRLYAKWTPKTYKVAFNANGGNGTMGAQTMTYGKAANLRANAFTRTGHKFLGWSKTKTGNVGYKNAASVKNLRKTSGTTTLYAVWGPNTYQVAFDANGGSGTMSTQTMTYGTGANLRANAFTRPGHMFAGWAKTKTGGVEYQNGAYVKNLRNDSGTTTLYAVWRQQGLSEALDSALSFTTGGDAPWFSQTAVTHDGVDAVRSGQISDNQESWLQTTVTGPGTLSFWIRISCEGAAGTQDLDYLAVQVDGNVRWMTMGLAEEFSIGSIEIDGNEAHVIRWVYHKDEAISDGSDCAWLDQVEWTPAGGAPKSVGKSVAKRRELGIGAADDVAEVGSGAGPFAVTASNGEDAGAVADRDEETAWVPEGPGAAWVILSFEEPRNVAEVEVVGEYLPEGMRVLLSEDAEEWSEGEGGTARYVWVAFPEGAEEVSVREIWVLEEGE